MVVEYRNGLRRLVVGNSLIGKEGSNELSFYREDLTEKLNNYVLDIMKVIKPVSYSSFESMINAKFFTTLWQRKETVKVFRMLKFIEDNMNGDKDTKELLVKALISGWPQKCEGKTEEEMLTLGYGSCEDWLVEEEVK